MIGNETNEKSGAKKPYFSKSTLSGVASRAGQGALAGGVGGAIGKAAEAFAGEAIFNQAQRLARKKRAQKLRQMRAKSAHGKITEPAKKLVGPGFWMIAGIAVLKDILDLFVNISVFLAPLVVVYGLLVTFIILFYLIYNNIKFTTRKLAWLSLVVFIELIPFASIFPATTAGLVLVRIFEHSKHARKFAEKKTHALGKLYKAGL